ncbi:hypothetical protein [Actinokineospora sp. NBRC 105648]|uniref:hypothetical protein n=1 Tax=Actinokineospora sp. NBRC 105648 TaxID=3032206 RepID=UPI00255522DF|nr:hypothetical protein [Actinokineospora sp. NBRC 105648]
MAEQVIVSELVWIDQVIVCPECGCGGWRLLVDGLSAWAFCLDQEHRVEHPLVYPDLVRLVLAHPPGTRLGSTELRQWGPHELTAGGGAAWSPDHPGWVEWPQLAGGRARHQAVTEWALASYATDRVGAWIDQWGTTEPDRLQIVVSTQKTVVPSTDKSANS